MSTLVDTNIAARAAQPSHPMYQTAVDAVSTLLSQGELACVVPQVLYEFWVVCTRPVAQNGLGLSPTEAQAELARLKSTFVVRDDTAGILPEWEQIVIAYQVSGKNAHDARLVAAMKVHGIDRLLTFNTTDFQRYSGITVVSPLDVLQSTTPP